MKKEAEEERGVEDRGEAEAEEQIVGRRQSKVEGRHGLQQCV